MGWLASTIAPSREIDSETALRLASDALALHPLTHNCVPRRWEEIRRRLVISATVDCPGFDPEDLAGLAVEDMIRGWHTFKFGSQLQTWGSSILRNRYKQELRKRSRERAALGQIRSIEGIREAGGDVEAPSTMDTVHLCEIGELVDLVLRLMQRACAGTRSKRQLRHEHAGYLLYFLKLPLAEIVRQTGLSISTLRRIRNRIRKSFDSSPELRDLLLSEGMNDLRTEGHQ